jgi:3,4-dihydroxy 2-butanone 4-phosphate synthase/GTP cyclohydrolase II
LDASLAHIAKTGAGVVVLLNCGESGTELLAQFKGETASHRSTTSKTAGSELRTYGIGAQILRDCGVQKMTLMASPRRMPSMTGYDLEVTNFLQRTT